MAKKYKCPYCNERLVRKDLIDHIDKEHEELIPEGSESAQVVYDVVNNTKGAGRCRVCGSPTKWNSSAKRYDVLCGNPRCKQKMREDYQKNMLRVHGTYNILNNEEQQKKMLANRSISGTYKFTTDGGFATYTGSYEKKFLEFADKVMQIPSKDIMAPGPTLEYEMNGKKHFYITDFLYIPYNLIIEVKDGGSNPNSKDSVGMRSSRQRTIEKEKLITDRGEYNYLRLTDNQFVQLLEIFMEIKKSLIEDNDSKIIRIHESEEFKFQDQKTIDDEDMSMSVLSGDIFDSEIKHHIENFDKKVYEALLESENIVEDYNNFVQLKIDQVINSKKSSNVVIFENIRNTIDGALQMFVIKDEDEEMKKEFEKEGIKSEDDIKKYIISGVVHNPPKDPSAIKKLLEVRLKYVDSTIKLLKDMIQNNAKILGLSSLEIEQLLNINDVKDVQKLKDIITSNKSKFIDGNSIDLTPLGAGILIKGPGIEENEFASKAASLDNMLQELLHYDIIVMAHGTDAKEIEEHDEDYEYNHTKSRMDKQWYFAEPIKYNGKSYDKVVEFIRDAKKNGAKKIKLYSCNPGHYSLPDDLKDGVVFSNNSIWMEQEIDYTEHELINEQDLNDIPELYDLYLLEQNLISISEENGINYYDNYMLEQVSNEILYGDTYLIEDGVIKKVFDKLLEFIAKVIATIINLVKKLISAIKNFFISIKDKIQKRKKGKTSKKIKFNYAIVEDAKVIEAEADSQEEIKKAISRSCQSISKELKKKSDLQLKITNEIKKQAEAQKNKNTRSLSEEYSYLLTPIITNISEARKIDNKSDIEDIINIINYKPKTSGYKPKSHEPLENFKAYHIEPKIAAKNKKYLGGWDEELYAKSIEAAIVYAAGSYEVKRYNSFSAYVYTAGRNLKSVYLGTITVFDKNNPNDWEWEEKEILDKKTYDYLIKYPMVESTDISNFYDEEDYE